MVSGWVVPAIIGKRLTVDVSTISVLEFKASLITVKRRKRDESQAREFDL